jgi:uncharacterized protein (TIGR00369 family)
MVGIEKRVRLRSGHRDAFHFAMTDRQPPANATTASDAQSASRAPRGMRVIDLKALQARHIGTVVDHLGIEFLEMTPDMLSARMPVDTRTKQPAGILHGGSSVVLAETLGSVAASLCLPPGQRPVGLDINANHIRSVTEGWVIGVCRPIHIGRTTHVWQIEIRDEAQRLTCVSRFTVAVLGG